ncbi:PREDICTED: olfactory receptor 52I1-like [Pseudopodoces humilis]|uniref:olfactory receptor 52I1-like n=1 Tax=Pseudopodoces humilis TaxID=181119 RepID=UPI0006B7F9FC|nr:PREDICTED: olfactory receptor 52I1-like [Pseudopodoces humilis]
MASDPFNGSSSSFILLGVPGLEAFSTCLGILFCSAYVLAMAGNGVVLLVLGLDKALQAPSHCFLGMLAVVDVLMVTSVIPRMLSVLWLGSAEIGSVACFVQMFLVHSTTAEESGVLLAVAFDRYLAVCHPLRYRCILTGRAIAQVGLAIVLRALLFTVPLMVLVTSLPYCGSRPVPHSYCEHLALAGLACAGPGPSGPYSVAWSSLVVGTGLAFIAVSYGVILRAVLGKEPGWKALSTCGCHLCVVLLFYVPGIVSIYCQRFPGAVAAGTRVLLADLYLALPATLNPLVYSARSRQLRRALLKVLLPGGFVPGAGVRGSPGAFVSAKAAQGVREVSRGREDFNEL